MRAGFAEINIKRITGLRLVQLLRRHESICRRRRNQFQNAHKVGPVAKAAPRALANVLTHGLPTIKTHPIARLL
jgi:hypothetical protein